MTPEQFFIKVADRAIYGDPPKQYPVTPECVYGKEREERTVYNFTISGEEGTVHEVFLIGGGEAKVDHWEMHFMDVSVRWCSSTDYKWINEPDANDLMKAWLIL